MNHEDNWKEIEEVWIELANCTCGTELEMPCLHCEPEAFKVWYQMKFGEPGFNYNGSWKDPFCYPLERLNYLVPRYRNEVRLPWLISYNRNSGWSLYGYGKLFKTVKELVVDWQIERFKS